MDRGADAEGRPDAPLIAATVRGKAQATKTSRRNPHWAWWWESLAVCGSVACMAGILIILARTNDRPLSDWTFFLSLPATIAVFSTSAKSMAAFAVGAGVSQSKWLHFRSGSRPLRDLDRYEEASRGPLGSSWVLVAGPWGLVSIGALATVLALGFDVFVQQLVQLETRDVAVDDTRAVLGLSHEYIGGAKTAAGIILNPGAVDATTADVSMQGAIYRGLFGLDSPVVFKCPSSCSWDDSYVSLGFESTCSDVTEATVGSQDSSVWGEFSGGAYLLTPGGVNLSATHSFTSWQTAISVGALTLLTETPPWYRTPVSLFRGRQARPGRPPIARVAVLRTETNRTHFRFSPDLAEVLECDITLAASRLSNITARAPSNILSIGKEEPIQLRPQDSNAEGLTVLLDQTGEPTLQVNILDIFALANFFVSPRFAGEIYDGETPPALPQGTGYAFRSGNMSQVVQNMTRSMTGQLRSTFGVTATGRATSQVVFVRVQWEWLVLPLAVQLLSTACLVLVLASMATHPDMQSWKSSLVAVLFCHLTDSSRPGMKTLHPEIRSVEALKETAKRTKARLE